MRRLLVIAALCSGCLGSAYGELPERERDRFDRCRTVMSNMQCQTGDSLANTMCQGGLANRYAERTTEATRQQWLIDNGCPEAMVGRRATMSGSEAR